MMKYIKTLLLILFITNTDKIFAMDKNMPFGDRTPKNTSKTTLYQRLLKDEDRMEWHAFICSLQQKKQLSPLFLLSYGLSYKNIEAYFDKKKKN